MNTKKLIYVLGELWSEFDEKSGHTFLNPSLEVEYNQRRDALINAWKAWLFVTYGKSIRPSVQELLYSYVFKDSMAFVAIEVDFKNLCDIQRQIQAIDNVKDF